MIRRRDFLIGSALSSVAWAKPGSLSIAGIRFRVDKNGKSPWRFLHIHGDETTARDVLAQTIKKHQGTAFLVESSTRVVPISSLKIDPNRMFSREGAGASLRHVNEGASDTAVQSALKALDRGRKKFLKKILPPRGGILVALHNNSQGYSIKTELPISDKSSVKQPDAPHEFMLAASPRDFAVLEKSPFNVVLQQNPAPPDDGSLSRVCANRKIRYINIETALGNAKDQQAMLGWILANLPATAEFV